MSALDAEDLAYLRETQAEVRPTSALLFVLLESVPDGLGGRGATYAGADDGYPVQVRIMRVQDNTASGSVPQDLASRYAVGDLRKIVAPADQIAKPGDLLHDLDADRWYEVVTHGSPEAWTTANISWATSTGKRPPA